MGRSGEGEGAGEGYRDGGTSAALTGHLLSSCAADRPGALMAPPSAARQSYLARLQFGTYRKI
jgi:hypothetical protein